MFIDVTCHFISWDKSLDLPCLAMLLQWLHPQSLEVLTRVDVVHRFVVVHRRSQLLGRHFAQQNLDLHAGPSLMAAAWGHQLRKASQGIARHRKAPFVTTAPQLNGHPATCQATRLCTWCEAISPTLCFCKRAFCPAQEALGAALCADLLAPTTVSAGFREKRSGLNLLFSTKAAEKRTWKAPWSYQGPLVAISPLHLHWSPLASPLSSRVNASSCRPRAHSALTFQSSFSPFESSELVTHQKNCRVTSRFERETQRRAGPSWEATLASPFRRHGLGVIQCRPCSKRSSVSESGFTQNSVKGDQRRYSI